MALDSTRRKVTYESDGSVTQYSFAFSVFSPSDIAVYTGTGKNSDISKKLRYSTDYSVSLNADQNNAPGGVVILTTEPASGARIAILSAIPEIQPMVLTTHDGFDPRVLNQSADRAVALVQQLSERIDRAIVIEPTDPATPTEMKLSLFKLADHAEEWAAVSKEAAKSAKADALEAKASAESAAASESTATAAYTGLKDHLDDISSLTKITDVIKKVSESTDGVKAVGADLLGELTSGDMDYGYIADESEGVAASASSAIEACAENMENIKIAATAGIQAATYAMDAKTWAVSEESPDGTEDADSSTGRTQSAKTWALAAKASAEKAASITPGPYTTVEVFNSFMTSIYEACDEFIKGV